LPRGLSACETACTTGTTAATPGTVRIVVTTESASPPCDVGPITRSGVGPAIVCATASMDAVVLCVAVNTPDSSATPALIAMTARSARALRRAIGARLSSRNALNPGRSRIDAPRLHLSDIADYKHG